VPKTAYDNVIKGLSTEGIKVEVYGRDGKKKKVFYVGGSSVNNTGTNMMMEGAKQPYIRTGAGLCWLPYTTLRRANAVLARQDGVRYSAGRNKEHIYKVYR
jgi:hypothetical protein